MFNTGFKNAQTVDKLNFSKYIKTFEKCKKCGIVFTEFRSDGPAYCTILIVGHCNSIILLVEKNFQLQIIFQITLWPILTAFYAFGCYKLKEPF